MDSRKIFSAVSMNYKRLQGIDTVVMLSYDTEHLFVLRLQATG